MTTKLPYPEIATLEGLLDWGRRLIVELSKPKTDLFRLDKFTIAERLPDATKLGDGSVIFVTDAAGGAVPAYSRGGSWLRFDDNSVVS